MLSGTIHIVPSIGIEELHLVPTVQFVTRIIVLVPSIGIEETYLVPTVRPVTRST